MSRLVRIPQVVSWSFDPATGQRLSAESAGRPQHGTVVQDGYLERIMKYVPAEVLGFSVLINAILEQALKSAPKATMAGFPVTSIALAAFVVGWLVAPFHVWYVHDKKDAWIVNAVMAFVAFPFWSYAMGAIAFADFRDGNLAVILLVTFTALSGLIRPRFPASRADAAETADKAAERTPVRLEAIRPAPVSPSTGDLAGEDIFVPDEKVATWARPPR